MTTTVITGSFTGTGQSASFTTETNQITGASFNVRLDLAGAATGSVNLERSFDRGTTWDIVSTDATGTPCTFTTDAHIVVDEIEGGVYYRLNCTAVTGTINYRLGSA